MDKIPGYSVHVLALNLLRGPEYRATVTLERDDKGYKEIAIRISFPSDFTDDVMTRLHEEIANGIYLPRSEATRGLTEKDDGLKD